MNTNPIDFSDLEGDLDVVIGAPTAPETFLEAAAKFARSAQARETIKCPKCRGTGQWMSFSGYTGGECFKCKGSGSVTRVALKTDAGSVARRQQAAARRVERKTQDALDHRARIEAWKLEHAAAWAWIDNKCKTGHTANEFAESLCAGLYKYGSLTDGQLAAVERIVAQDAARKAAEQAAPVTGLDLSSVPEGMYAVPDGETRLKVRIDKPAPPSKWAGYVFVSDGAEYGSQRKYGRQAPGCGYVGGIVDQLKAIAANPRAASTAYGQLVGRCGVCGRKLEDAASIERGIGPVCANKF